MSALSRKLVLGERAALPAVFMRMHIGCNRNRLCFTVGYTHYDRHPITRHERNYLT